MEKASAKTKGPVVNIITKDQKVLKIEKRIAYKSNMIRQMLEDAEQDTNEDPVNL